MNPTILGVIGPGLLNQVPTLAWPYSLAFFLYGWVLGRDDSLVVSFDMGVSKIGVPYFGVRIIRILRFRVPY